MRISLEKMLNEFLEYPSYNKYKRESYNNFSNGINMNRWFYKNKNFILSSNNEICKKITEQYNEYKLNVEKEHNARKKNEFTVTFEFSYMCKEFSECSDNRKFEHNSDIEFKNGMLMGKWFEFYKQKIFSGKGPNYVAIQTQYKNKVIEDKMREKVDYSKKKQYFLITKGYEKFSKSSDLKFYDGKRLYTWFEENKNDIFSSDYQIDIKIKNQYYEYCYFLELEEMFLNADDEKFDEYGNRRFASGALMYVWFISNLNYIKNSGEEIDKEIMLQYNNYLDKNKIYKDDDKDLVKIKKY